VTRPRCSSGLEGLRGQLVTDKGHTPAVLTTRNITSPRNSPLMRNRNVHHSVHKSLPLQPCQKALDPSSRLQSLPTQKKKQSHFHLCLDLLSDLFPRGFITKHFYSLVVSPECYMSCPSHPRLFDFNIRNCEAGAHPASYESLPQREATGTRS
jgi:hypothetical protein